MIFIKPNELIEEVRVDIKKFLEIKKRSRRDFLYSSGVLLALPFLESLYSTRAMAEVPPLRTLFGFFEYGIIQKPTSRTTSRSFDLVTRDDVKQLFAPVKSYTNIFENVNTKTGASHKETLPATLNARNGMNFSRLANQVSGGDSAVNMSPYSSIGVGGKERSIYSLDAIFKALGPFKQQENDMRTIANAPQLTKKQQRQKSSLDFLVENIKSLKNKLSSSDKFVLDRHLELARSYEKIALPILDDNTGQMQVRDCGTINKPVGSLSYVQKLSFIEDLIVMSFACDNRRNLSFFKEDPDNPEKHKFYYNDDYPIYKAFVEKSRGRGANYVGNAKSGIDRKNAVLVPRYHTMTHKYDQTKDNKNQNIYSKKEVIETMCEIDKRHVKLFTNVATKLSKIQDVNGKSILDNSLIFMTGDMSGTAEHNMNRHNLHSVPCFTIGKAGGNLRTGRDEKLGNISTGTFQNALLKAIGSKQSNNNLFLTFGDKNFDEDDLKS